MSKNRCKIYEHFRFAKYHSIQGFVETPKLWRSNCDKVWCE